MPMEEEPVVGAIYEDPEGLAFEVLSFDEDDGTIEVQYEDGEVGEIDIDAWYEMELQKMRSADHEDSADDEEEEVEPEKVSKRAVVEEDDDDDDDVDDYDEDDNDDDYNS